ncbi:FAD-dependent oxidoreductase [uncultured Paludibaculum sp.]|uniref:FAD-dependent oxidoreductase n=1 Tax=uncultured Paludibaculum sp. TaxID=1765020 RepID=UPI002AAA883F|nr:FAD-dependent oxidoreductase [uncultured Paludibaculum sp.]
MNLNWLTKATILLATGNLFGASPTVQNVVVYGGTAAGITAAVQAARMGKKVALVAPEKHLGGITVDGLGGSDIDNHDFRNSIAVGGLALEFYTRVGQKYGKQKPVWQFEPHVAEAVFEDLLEQAHVPVFRQRRLQEPLKTSVIWGDGKVLKAIVTESGEVFEGQQFVDATIEGDLLAAAGVETVIGRESNVQYGETKNGIRGENEYRQFAVKVDPYKVPGVPSSGLIATIQDEPYGEVGSGDHRIQGYCFRLCLTRVPGNRLAIVKPPHYDPSQYEIYRRYARAGGQLFTPKENLPNGKTDLGSWHDLSANLYGMNFEYPGGSYAARERVYRQHLEFTWGLLYFLAHDPGLPERVRASWRDWGLCKDEFTDNGGWPRQLYVRDGRRMVSDLVLTEWHTRRVNAPLVEDGVAVAYWPPDMHHVRRIVKDGAAYNEGFVFGGKDWGPFSIPYRALTPRRAEVRNLLAASCPSSSHVAYGAIRLEWTFLALGQAAGAAAGLAEGAVQDVPYKELRKVLVEAGAVVSLQGVSPLSGR